MKELFKKLNIFLQHAQDAVLCHYKITLIIVPLLFIFLAINTGPPKFASSLDSLLNKNSENYHALKKFNRDFQIAPELFVNFKKQNPWTESELCKLRKDINDLSKIESVFDLETAFDLREQTKISEKGKLDRIFFNKIINLDCYDNKTLEDPLKHLQKNSFKNLFTDQDKKSFSFTLFSKISPDEIGPEGYLQQVKIIKEKIYEMAKTYNLDTQLFGNISYQYSLLEGLNQNVKYNILVLFLLAILFYLFFRTWKVSLIYFSTLLISTAFLVILFSLTGSPIDVLNNSLFLFLALTTLSDYVFVLLDCSDGFLKSFRRLIFPCFLTSLTTVIGFFSLMSSGQEITGRFGLMTGLCAIVEWAILFFWAPCLIKFFNLSRPIKKNYLWTFLETIMKKTPHLYICIFLLSVFVLAPFTFNSINFNEKPLELFDDSFQIVQDLKEFKKDRGFVAFTSFLTREDSFSLEMKESIKNIDIIKNIEWASDIKKGLQGEFSSYSFDHILRGIQNEDWYKRRFANGLQHNHLFLKEFDVNTIYKLEADLSKICPKRECYLAGESYAYAKFAGKIPELFLNSSLLSIFLVGLFILFISTIANNKFSASYLFSVFFGVASLFLFLGFSQIEINFVTAGVVSILVGLTGDNAIHFASVQIIDGKSLKEALDQRGLASFISTIMMLCLCCVFFIMKFNPPKYFGLTLLIGLSFNIFGDYWILKGLNKKAK